MRYIGRILLFAAFSCYSYGSNAQKPVTRTHAEFETMLKEMEDEGKSHPEGLLNPCTALLAKMPEIPTSKRLKAVIKEKWQPLIDLILAGLQSDPSFDISIPLLEVLPKRILSLSEMDEEVMQVILELFRGNFNEKNDLIKSPLTKKQFINAILIDLPAASIKGKDLIAAYKLVGQDPATLLQEIKDGTIDRSILQIGKPKKVVN